MANSSRLRAWIFTPDPGLDALMIVRLLLFAALAWLVWRIWTQWQQKLRGPQPPPDQAGSERFELMQRCSQCGAYLPSTALSRSGRCGRCSD
jgi:hypothetical protein